MSHAAIRVLRVRVQDKTVEREGRRGPSVVHAFGRFTRLTRHGLVSHFGRKQNSRRSKLTERAIDPVVLKIFIKPPMFPIHATAGHTYYTTHTSAGLKK